MNQKEMELRATWKQHFHIICNDVSWLVSSQHIWEEIAKIVEKNPNLKKSDVICQWLVRNYYIATAMLINKQLDKPRNKSISLYILFDKMARYYECSSRNNKYSTDIRKDQEELKKKTERIRTLVDKRLKHFDLTPDGKLELPDNLLNEIDDIIQYLDDLIKKYNQFFKANEPISFPTILESDEWKNPLRFAWIIQ